MSTSQVEVDHQSLPLTQLVGISNLTLGSESISRFQSGQLLAAASTCTSVSYVPRQVASGKHVQIQGTLLEARERIRMFLPRDGMCMRTMNWWLIGGRRRGGVESCRSARLPGQTELLPEPRTGTLLHECGKVHSGKWHATPRNSCEFRDRIAATWRCRDIFRG